MKKFLTLISGVILAIAAYAFPAFTQLQLSWNPSPDADVLGYNVYEQLPGQTNWQLYASTATTNVILIGAVRGTVYCVTATNATDESLPSNTVQDTFPTPPVLHVPAKAPPQ